MSALVKCGSCGNDIAKTAALCPRCGAPSKKKLGLLGKLFVVCLTLVVMATCSAKMSRNRAGAPSAAAANRAPDQALPITASALHAAYDANEVAADAQYKGRLVDVTGKVDSISKDFLDNPVVTLATGEMFQTLHCSFDSDHAPALANLTKGQSVTLQGRVTGSVIGSVMVKDCVIR